MSDLWVEIRDAIASALPTDTGGNVQYCLYDAQPPHRTIDSEAIIVRMTDAVMATLDRRKTAPDSEGREASIYQLTMGNLAHHGASEVGLAIAIAAAVEHGLTWRPETSLDPTKPEPGIPCHTRWDEFTDGGPYPDVTLRLTCIEHGLTGQSTRAKAATNPRMRLQAEARSQLELRHREAGLL